MYKTVWAIYHKEDNYTTELTYYHFGKEPKFPSWYMIEEGKVYEIEMIWNLRLVCNFETFTDCLFKAWIVKTIETI